MPQDTPKRSEEASRALETHRERGGALEPTVLSAVEQLADHAPGLLPLLASDPSVLSDALARPLGLDDDASAMRLLLQGQRGETRVDGPELRRALRRARHRGVVRIALREIERVASVEQTSAEMALLASVILDAALEGALLLEEQSHGQALDHRGERVGLTCLGMGKLGGRELNLGSDVDLCFFYATDEARVVRSDGSDGERSVHDLYSRVVRRATRMLSEVTEDGFCFRVDLRLRPEGSQGPLVNSLDSAERYYTSFGRTWERAALLRARPVAGDLEVGHELLRMLRPFVHRRRVDPSLAGAMQEMLLRSRRELGEGDDDVKLGRGGIREAEFFVQALQLIWGGQHPELQVPHTLEALERLRRAALVTDREARELTDAWALLRRVEHRIHVWTGFQTHALPRREPERFAESLGFESLEALRRELDAARADVARLFAGVMPDAGSDDERRFDPLLEQVAAGAPAEQIAEELAKVLEVADPRSTAGHLGRLARWATAPLGPVTRQRLPQLGRTLLEEVSGSADPDAALRMLAEFFNRLGGRWPYERMLLSKPRLTRRLIGLFGASETLGRALVGHPEDIDLVMGESPPSLDEVAAAHDTVLAEMEEDPDPEALVATLRRLSRSLSLRIGLAYVASEIDVFEAASRLSAIAEGQVRVSLEGALRWGVGRWGQPDSGLVVCAMGKLGGSELGFAADLDLVFVYGADGETTRNGGAGRTHAEFFTRVAQRTMRLLRQSDAQGPGYETDTRLRPSGSKGTLVVSLEAFDRYHHDHAAGWERQALVRARPIAGPPEIREALAGRLREIAFGRGAPEVGEVTRLRARMQRELAGEGPDRYHPKLGFGGLWDVEFLVQWLQMKHGADARLHTASTRRAIEALGDAGVLDPIDAESLAHAYLFLRRVEQSLRLHDAPPSSHLHPSGRTGQFVARGLGVMARDGLSMTQALDLRYRAHADAVRERFERFVGPVDVPAPWPGDAR